MKFKNLAWGAFIFARMTRNDYASTYQELVKDVQFLNRLKTNPSLDDFQRLRDFLTHYGVPWARTNLAEQYMSVWPKLEPHISKLADAAIDSRDLRKSNIRDAITGAFEFLKWPNVWGGDTVASKVIHFFNVSLFVMWDDDIQSAYGKTGSQGYLEFLCDMQSHAKEIISDFRRLSLGAAPDEFLSQQLGYDCVRPLTKLIDDYNWVTITKHWPQEQPDWLSKL